MNVVWYFDCVHPKMVDILLMTFCFWPWCRWERCPWFVLTTCSSNLDSFTVPLPRVTVQRGDKKNYKHRMKTVKLLTRKQLHPLPHSSSPFLSCTLARLIFCVCGQEVETCFCDITLKVLSHCTLHTEKLKKYWWMSSVGWKTDTNLLCAGLCLHRSGECEVYLFYQGCKWFLFQFCFFACVLCVI